MSSVFIFDAYGTLFDVHAAIARHRQLVGPDADRVSATWRNKQLEYSWTLTLAGHYMFSMGGIMGAGTKMMAAGLSMGQVQAVTRETIAYAREKIGEDAIGEIVGAIPGLSQFV